MFAPDGAIAEADAPLKVTLLNVFPLPEKNRLLLALAAITIDDVFAFSVILAPLKLRQVLVQSIVHVPLPILTV